MSYQKQAWLGWYRPSLLLAWQWKKSAFAWCGSYHFMLFQAGLDSCHPPSEILTTTPSNNWLMTKLYLDLMLEITSQWTWTWPGWPLQQSSRSRSLHKLRCFVAMRLGLWYVTFYTETGHILISFSTLLMGTLLEVGVRILSGLPEVLNLVILHNLKLVARIYSFGALLYNWCQKTLPIPSRPRRKNFENKATWHCREPTCLFFYSNSDLDLWPWPLTLTSCDLWPWPFSPLTVPEIWIFS